MTNPAERESATRRPETIRPSVDSLLDKLAFHPTPALVEARAAIVAGLADESTDGLLLSRAWGEYADITEAMVGSAEDPATYTRAQIGAIIHKALIFSVAGDTLRYLEELDDAEVYAHNEGIDDVRGALQDEINEKTSTLEMSSEVLVMKLKGVISEENRAFLRDLIEQGDDFEDMISHAYGMILEEGGDPDEVLAGVGVIE